MTFAVARSLDEVLTAMANGARPIAGGTDLVVGARQGKGSLPEDLIAIDRVSELAEITETDEGVRVGAGVTHARLMTDPSIVGAYTGLADASALVGSPATRNVGTLGGNVMNSSPAMDTGAPLLTFGAEAELRSNDGTRLVPLAELWTGPGRNSAEDNELCVALHLPRLGDRSGSAYVRLEYRRAMEIAVVGAAASVLLNEDGTLVSAAVALTAVAPTIIELDGVGGLVAGRTNDAELGQIIYDLAAEQATPISDLRAGDTYRRHCVGVMARRALDAAVRRASGEVIAVPVNRSLGVGANA
jgi:CO/xanthine dehydrogenase FAD-binding subunit